uniref:F-box domain-containing protein n=1 Tax=Caenorhabditis tropicalis TaxID=1561998 RepID=A0A1I7TT00_9PELO
MDDFRAQILKETRELMQNEQQHEESMKSWNGSETKGFELKFGGTKRGVPQNSGVVGQVFISEDGGFEAIITGYLVKNQLRSVISSFTVTPSSSLKSDLAEGLHSLVLAVGSALTLNHILMLDSVRNKILRNLTTKDVARLSSTCKIARQVLTSTAVDNTFWKGHLKTDFGAEKVKNTIATGRKFYGVYCEEARARRNDNAAPARQVNQNPLLIGVHEPHYDPLRVPRGPMRPYHPDPDTEFFNPNGGFLPPGVPGGNPQVPDLFRGPDHPDLNPMAGMFGGSRGGGSQGRPFMRGPPGPGGFGGGSGFI